MKEDREKNNAFFEQKRVPEDANIMESSFEKWSTFKKHNTIKTPENFNDTLWTSFEKKKLRSQKIQLKIIYAAAAIVCAILLYVSTYKPKELTYSEKEQLLDKAKNMLSNFEQKNTLKHIIYENDMIIIYTTK